MSTFLKPDIKNLFWQHFTIISFCSGGITTANDDAYSDKLKLQP